MCVAATAPRSLTGCKKNIYYRTFYSQRHSLKYTYNKCFIVDIHISDEKPQNKRHVKKDSVEKAKNLRRKKSPEKCVCVFRKKNRRNKKLLLLPP